MFEHLFGFFSVHCLRICELAVCRVLLLFAFTYFLWIFFFFELFMMHWMYVRSAHVLYCWCFVICYIICLTSKWLSRYWLNNRIENGGVWMPGTTIVLFVVKNINCNWQNTLSAENGTIQRHAKKDCASHLNNESSFECRRVRFFPRFYRKPIFSFKRKSKAFSAIFPCCYWIRLVATSRTTDNECTVCASTHGSYLVRQ